MCLKTFAGVGRVPVLVGGTGLYLRALTEGLFQGPARSMHLRERLEAIAEAAAGNTFTACCSVWIRMRPSRIAARDKPKIIRALEVRLETGKPLTEHLKVEPRRPLKGFVICTVGLDPPREECYSRIDVRVERMLRPGWWTRCGGFWPRGFQPDAKPLGAIGYRHVLANLDNSCAWDDTIRMIQRDTRRYAKRQLTWFRRQANTTWFGGPGENKEIKEEVHRQSKPFPW